MLEYTGRGKSIIDVGLAQARYPLDTTNHYFEIEIVDPGENCYIAIGLAKRVSTRNQRAWENKELLSRIVKNYMKIYCYGTKELRWWLGTLNAT